jgi:hypothetical protein
VLPFCFNLTGKKREKDEKSLVLTGFLKPVGIIKGCPVRTRHCHPVRILREGRIENGVFWGAATMPHIGREVLRSKTSRMRGEIPRTRGRAEHSARVSGFVWIASLGKLPLARNDAGSV